MSLDFIKGIVVGGIAMGVLGYIGGHANATKELEIKLDQEIQRVTAISEGARAAEITDAYLNPSSKEDKCIEIRHRGGGKITMLYQDPNNTNRYITAYQMEIEAQQ